MSHPPTSQLPGNLEHHAPPHDSRQWAWMVALWDALALLIVLVGMIVAFGATTSHFMSWLTFQSIFNSSPDIIVIATGMTLVLLLGEIDLSVGSVLGLCNAVLGIAMVWWNWPAWAAILACLATGLFCGMLNGLITVIWRIPSFIVTLGMLEAARGAAYQMMNSRDIFIGEPILRFDETRLATVSVLFFIAVGIVILAEIVLTKTVFGRYIKAIGNNETAVRLSGIDARPVKVWVFALSGLMAGLGAVMQVSRFGSANPNYGLGVELSAIAAAVIGGTSLLGGRGSAGRTLLGVMIIAVLGAGLNQLGAKDPTKRIVTGVLIVAAVVLDYYRQRLRGARTGV